MKDIKQISDQIVAWLKNYAETNKRKALVIGVSGGVDSALVSTLCAKTGLPTICVTMPCHSKEDQTDRGMLHINWLQLECLYKNVQSVRIDLTATFEVFKTTINYLSKDFDMPLAYANTKSRLRMIALYQVATVNEGLVIGTGNKVEDYGVGFFTKYGDGGVDLSPIGDLTKTEVRAMCRELGVLPELTNAIPTDGLWEDTRTDEQQLGASYEELEWVMWFLDGVGMVGYNPDELSLRQREVIKSYQKWHNAGQHKLNPIPVFKLYDNKH
jgi:NAD+ synthase